MSQSTSYATNGTSDAELRFRGLILDASLADDSGGQVLHRILSDHFGIDPMELAQTTTYTVDGVRHVIPQAGLDKYLAAPGRRYEMIGLDSPIGDPRVRLSVPKMLGSASLTWPGVTKGQPTWERFPVGYQRMLRCLMQGLVLIHDDKVGPAAIWLTTVNGGQSLRYQTILSASPAHTLAIAEEIKRLGSEHSPFIGEMFTYGFGERRYLPRPQGLSRDDLILAPTLLDRIDKHAVGMSRAARRLTAAGQHLNRGLLLHGPPGTGKTHTLRYLISQLPAETTIVIANPDMGTYAYEWLFPIVGRSAMVVFDDVDSVAGDRSVAGSDRSSLFRLLENMDGIQARGDILFVLTTNRLDVLEPAIAARPGRIDEILEVPRPNDDCRRRLFDRYAQGMDLDITDAEIDEIIGRTDGVTASFTKEMLRRATVIAVRRGAGPGPSRLVQVTGADINRALDEMLDPTNPATRLLLGAQPEHAVRGVAISTGDSQ